MRLTWDDSYKQVNTVATVKLQNKNTVILSRMFQKTHSTQMHVFKTKLDLFNLSEDFLIHYRFVYVSHQVILPRRLRPLDVVKVLWYVLVKYSRHSILGFDLRKWARTNILFTSLKVYTWWGKDKDTLFFLRCLLFNGIQVRFWVAWTISSLL